MRNTLKSVKWDVARAAAREQHSLVTRAQLTDGGWSRTAIRYAVQVGELERVTSDVFRIGGAAATPSQRALAAVLHIEGPSAISHGSAATLWGVPGFRLEPVDVTKIRGRSTQNLAGSILHRPTFDVGPHIVTLEGVPVLTPIATVWSLATSGKIHPKKIERTIDTLWSRRLITSPSLAQSVEQFGKRGRTGTVLMRELSGARPVDFVAPESGLEARFISILDKRNIRGFVRQKNVGDEEQWLGRVDFVHEIRRIVVQIDGNRFHSALVDRHHDDRQTQLLRNSGWDVLRFNEWMLWHDPQHVLADVFAALSRSRRAA